MKVLVINSGSSSVKYQVIETTTQTVEIEDNIQRVTDHAAAIKEILGKVKVAEIAAVGHRRARRGKVPAQRVGHRRSHAGNGADLLLGPLA